ncbi:hypothetical protein PUR57_00260, partial [Streptomyces sp. JV176]|nr:hypothetical protein [Streptomyces sp. JV176]
FNFLLAPPVWVATAGESMDGLARRMRQLLLRIGEGLTEAVPVERAASRARCSVYGAGARGPRRRAWSGSRS